MKKLLLGIVFASLLLTPALRADEPKKEGSAEPKVIVWDGDQIGDNAKGWANGAAGKVEVAAQDKVVRTAGKKAVAFRAQGKEFLGCGWNWFGWFPEDDGTDIAGYKSLQFWAKLDGTAKPTILNVTLVSSDKAKKAGDACSLFKYNPDLADGKWHQVTIPIADLDAKRALNRGKVWEAMFASWSQEPVDYTLYIDEIAFVGKADRSSEVQSGSATPLPVKVAANDSNLRYIGRWDMTDPMAPRASWTYSLVTAKFKGTALNARLKGGGFYQVTVDGKATSVVAPVKDREVYPIAKDLPAGEHVVEIVRRTEGAWIAPLAFLGFELEKDGQLMPLPPRSDHRLLIIGDSISCGYGNEATRDEGNPPAKENGYMTYGGIAARKLGAEVQIIAWSGRKLYPDNTMVEVFPRTLAMDAEPKFDMKSWVPGVVLIDLGTNDFGNAKKQPDEKGWIDAYKSFIKTIRASAPDSYVFVASGPMGTAANWDRWAKTVVADLEREGDRRIAYLPFATQDVQGDGIGGHWHPNLTTQGKMADRLTREIEKAVGWR